MNICNSAYNLSRTFLALKGVIKISNHCLFSDSDKEDLNKETLEKQYKIVKRETNTSMVCQFGDLSISKMKVADFQGEITQKDTFFSLISDIISNIFARKALIISIAILTIMITWMAGH